MSKASQPRVAALRPHVIVLVAYAVLTLALTYPLVVRLSTHLAGDDIDVWINPWANWWLTKTVSEGLNPYHTNYLFYPQGVSLVFHSFSPLNTFVWWVLKPLCGSVASYNVTILLTYTLSGYSMWLLARYWTGDDYAAFLGGAVFAFSPYQIIESARPHLVTTQWIPLACLYLIRAAREQSARYGCLSAVFFALCALSGWHLFFFAALCALVWLTYTGLVQRELWTAGSLRALLALTLLTLLLVAPLLYPVLRELVTSGISYMAASQHMPIGNHPLAFFIPSQYHPILGQVFAEANTMIGHNSTRPAFMGWIVLVMSLHAALSRKLKTRFWGLALVVFLLLSLGPALPLRTGELLRIPWSGPVVALFRHPFRFNVLISLCLSVLVACDLAQLLRPRGLAGARERPKLLLTGVLTGLVVFEYLTVPFPTTYPKTPVFYHKLASIEDHFAVVEIPIGRQADKYSMYYQTVHAKRLVGGMVARTPPGAYDYVVGNTLLCAGWKQEPGSLAPSEIPGLLQELADDDIRYVILQKYLMDTSTLKAWESLLSGYEVYEDDMLTVYTTQVRDE